MKINTSFEITEDNILNAIEDCRNMYDIKEIDKYIALDAIVANTFGLGESAGKVVDCLLDDDCKRDLLDTFADQLCHQVYTEIMDKFGLGK